MRSTLCETTSLHLLPTSFKSLEAHRNSIFKPLKFSSRKSLKLTNSLRTSINQGSEGVSDDELRLGKPIRLPVVIKRAGRVSRYLWNGNQLKLIGVDVGSSSVLFNFGDGFQNLFRITSSIVKDFFIPKQVDQNYMSYVKWKFLHRVFSSALQVLATQAMFRAIGIGHSRSLPSAAAFNWILKEGLGRLSRCIYTASLASAFDTNLKRVRFSTSALFSLSIGVELLTPLFPQYFLLLASVANIAKQISLACYLATGSAVHQSFAVANNLGEVSAKSQIQTVCFDNIGLMLAAVLNMLSKNNPRLQACLPFAIYPLFAAIDLFGIYQGLKDVNLRTLTKDRLELILNKWIEFNRIPSPAEVSKDEGINLFYQKAEKELWPIRIGCLDPNVQIPLLSVESMQSLSNEDYYFVCIETIPRGWRRNSQQGLVLCLREGTSTADMIMGLLQACYVRKSLASSDALLSDWSSMVEHTKRQAQDDYIVLYEQMKEQGWAVKNILLNAKEQIRYSFVDD